MRGRASIAVTACTATAVSGLILKKTQVAVDPSIAGDLWNVTRVGVDLPGVKDEYTRVKGSGELKADGYLPTGCFPDRNLKTRDLQGKSTSYEGPVSVIRYEDVIPKTEQEPMTTKVCYEFCRRFDQIKFFGITNGSKCYCEPMFVVATAGNTGGCKVACEGNPGEMCGGPDMSSIYEMHNCPPKEKFSDEQMTNFNAYKTQMADLGLATKTCIDDLVKAGSKLVETQKQKGNTVSMPHQKAMTESYQSIIADMNALPFEAAKVAADLETALGTYAGLGDSSGEADTEAAMKAIELAAENVESAFPKLQKVFHQCSPNITTDGRAITFYTPINNSTSAQSCSGKFIGSASIVSGDDPEDSCAQMCMNTLAPEACVGFQVYKGLLGPAYVEPTWVEVAEEGKIGRCPNGGIMRFGKDDEFVSEDFTWLGGGGFVCWEGVIRGAQDYPWTHKDGRRCYCTEGGVQEQVGSAGEVCMMFSAIEGVTQYNKPDCATTAPLEGKCYVPKTKLSGHLLHTKMDTVSLPYCFDGNM